MSKILILSGSARKNGNSAALVEQFAKGATEAGNEVTVFECAHHQVSGCYGCNYCLTNGNCGINDDFQIVRQQLIDCDVIVFATPVYYFGMTAQLKAVIDRFYSTFTITEQLRGKRAVLIVTQGQPSAWATLPTIGCYEEIIRMQGWEDYGQIICKGVVEAGAIAGRPELQQAYELGKSIK